LPFGFNLLVSSFWS